MAWTAVVTDTFSRANSGPVSTPGNTTGVGNGWIDVTGSAGSIVSDQLNVAAIAQQAGSTLILRPTGEDVGGASSGSRIVLQFVATKANPVLARFGAVLQCNGLAGTSLNGYFFQATSSGGTGITAGPIISGVTANPTSGANSASYSGIVNTDGYQLDTWVYQNSVGPAFLQATFTNLTTSTVLATTTLAYDSTSGVPSTGQQGIPCWEQTNGTPGTCIYTSAITYTGSPVAGGIYLSGPSTGTVGSPSTFTLVPSGTTAASTIVTPASTVGADTFSPTTVTIPSGSTTPVTFTVTPNTTSGSRTISMTNNQSLTNLNTVAFSAGSSSISLSPTSAAGSTINQTVTITGIGTSFTGSPFSISGSFRSNLQSQTVSSGTAGTITLDPGVYGNGNITVTDTGSSSTATLTVTAPVNGSANVGYIGDSITASDVNDTFGALCGYVNTRLNSLGYTTAHTLCKGLDGASTQTWLPSGSYLNAALAAFTGAGMVSGDLVHIMLGTNDARPSTSESRSTLTPTQHFANMSLIVAAVVAYGFKVIITKPIWTWPYANQGFNNAEIWPYNCNALYGQYFAQDITLVDDVNVFIGDTAGYEYAQQNPSTFLQSTGTAPGVHPANSTQDQILGAMWATAIANRYGASGGGGGSGGFWNNGMVG